jgi:hypothetical protein
VHEPSKNPTISADCACLAEHNVSSIIRYSVLQQHCQHITMVLTVGGELCACQHNGTLHSRHHTPAEQHNPQQSLLQAVKRKMASPELVDMPAITLLTLRNSLQHKAEHRQSPALIMVRGTILHAGITSSDQLSSCSTQHAASELRCT